MDLSLGSVDRAFDLDGFWLSRCHVGNKESIAMMRSFITSLSGLLVLIFMSSAAAADPEAQAGSWSSLQNDAVSTGVGNAGSFGIGSGTADSLSNGNGTATATATSDGTHEANTYNISDSSVSTKTLSVQDLESTSTGNYTVFNAGPDPTNSPLPTGSIGAGGASFSNFAGILNNGWNVGTSSNVIATNNISVNGGLAQR
jgi:hypothetical protein